MAQQNQPRRAWQQSIRPALIISLIMGVVAGVVVTISASGGTRNGLQLQLGGIAFLIAFVVGLLVISLLMMVAKENPTEMGRGSGVQRSSEISDEELSKIEAAEAGRPARADAASEAPATEDADATVEAEEQAEAASMPDAEGAPSASTPAEGSSK